MTKKVKARDIVYGWPMSRSTGGGFRDVENYELEKRFRLSFIRNILDADYVLWTLLEIQETVNYHRDQERMVDLFRATPQGSHTVTLREPGYWLYETSGELEPIVMGFLNDERLTPNQVDVLKMYFRQWIYADVWNGAEIDELRRMIDEVETQDGLNDWSMKAMDYGIDPL